MRAEYNATKARLNADPLLAGRGSDAIRMNSAGLPVLDTYWVMFGGGPDTLDDGRLAATQRADADAEYVYTVRLVSVTFDAVLTMAERADAQLIGWAPTVAGRTCQPISLDEGQSDVDDDTRVTPPLLFIDRTYVLKSNRA